LKAVADTSSLVHPAKVSSFWALMKDTFQELLISEAVFQEILSRKDKSRHDVPIIISAIDEGWIKVRKGIRIVEPLPSYLGKGEKETINLMLKERLDWLLMDDKLARNVARSVGLNPRYSVYLLPFWIRKDIISKSKAHEMLDQLIKTGYNLKSTHYLAVRELIEGASRPRR
jgi:predicted nucleic acid-binding protein